jgi:hypothetical protein
MRLSARSILAASAALAALALPGAATAQSWGGYYYAPPAPQYAPPAAPYWSVAYDPFFSQPMWGYGYSPAPAPQAWPTAYAGAQRPTAPRVRAARAQARDPFRSMFDDPFFTQPFFTGSLFDDPFFTEPWGFEPMLTAPWPTAYAGARPLASRRTPFGTGAGASLPPMQAWAGAPSMLGYGSFASDDFWNWARFGDIGDSAWAGSSASAYSYTARNSNGQCVHVSRTTRNGQTVSHRENCGAAPPPAPAPAPGDPVYYDMGRDFDE